MSIMQISVFLENKSGALANLTSVLAENKVNLQAMNVAETSEFGIVRMIVKDVYNAANILKEEGYVCKLTPVVAITIGDTPGSLNDTISILNTAGIDVDYMYAFLGGRAKDTAHIILKVADNSAAEAALRTKGVELLTQEEAGEL